MGIDTSQDSLFRSFVETLGDCILRRDFIRLQGLLSPALQAQVTPAALEAFLMKGIDEIRELDNAPDLYPGEMEVSCGSCGLAELLELYHQKKSYPDRLGDLTEVKPDDFRRWMLLALLTTEEDQQTLGVDGFYDLWLVVSEHQGQLRAAYFEVHDLD